MEFVRVVEWAGRLMEGAGVAIIVVGAGIATMRYLAQSRRRDPATVAYADYRATLGRAILLGLEFLVAGDIIRSVAIQPTFRSVGILAIIVAIRTFLSLELELEIEGRWPWQSGGRGQAAAGRESASALDSAAHETTTAGATDVAAPASGPRAESR